MRLICKFAIQRLIEMKQILAAAIVLLSLLNGCKDPAPAEVVLNPIPEPEPSRHIIDTYYYVQFLWGRGDRVDTTTFEIPDEGESIDDIEYINLVKELRSEPVLEPNELDSTVYDTVGWHYSSATILYPFSYAKHYPEELPDNDDNVILRSELHDPLDLPGTLPVEGIDSLFTNVFWMSFSRVEEDIKQQYWDIQDYLLNPYINVGSVKWGRVGNNIVADSLFNSDAREGVVLHYIDDANMLWESDNPPTFQVNSYFEVEEKTQNLRDGQSYFIIEGEMQARLYNQWGESKELRAGKFRLRIIGDIELSEPPA